MASSKIPYNESNLLPYDSGMLADSENNIVDTNITDTIYNRYRYIHLCMVASNSQNRIIEETTVPVAYLKVINYAIQLQLRDNDAIGIVNAGINQTTKKIWIQNNISGLRGRILLS